MQREKKNEPWLPWTTKEAEMNQWRERKAIKSETGKWRLKEERVKNSSWDSTSIKYYITDADARHKQTWDGTEW